MRSATYIQLALCLMDMETVLGKRPPISLFLIFSYQIILTPAHLQSKGQIISEDQIIVVSYCESAKFSIHLLL